MQVRYIGVSNETSFGVMEFLHAAKTCNLPKIVSIQNNYSLLVRCHYEGISWIEDTFCEGQFWRALSTSQIHFLVI